MTRRRERGATMVEFSIVAAVFFTAIFLVFQAAFLGRAHLAARYGSTSGAEAGSVTGDENAADYDVLKRIQRAASVGGKDAVQKVVIFKATGPGSSVPAECLTGGVSGLCNVYTGTDMDRAEAEFGPGGWAADDYWPPSSRAMSRSAGTDYIGVYVETKAGGIGGPFPQMLDDTAIARLEAAID